MHGAAGPPDGSDDGKTRRAEAGRVSWGGTFEDYLAGVVAAGALVAPVSAAGAAGALSFLK